MISKPPMLVGFEIQHQETRLCQEVFAHLSGSKARSQLTATHVVFPDIGRHLLQGVDDLPRVAGHLGLVLHGKQGSPLELLVRDLSILVCVNHDLRNTDQVFVCGCYCICQGVGLALLMVAHHRPSHKDKGPPSKQYKAPVHWEGVAQAGPHHPGALHFVFRL